MSAIQFSASLNTTQLQNALTQSNQQVGAWARGVENQVSGVDAAMAKLGAGLAVYFGAGQLKQFGMEVIEVRGQFQQLGIAFETMLGSKDKADKLMQEAITFAAKTPFTLSDVATNIKQLMAMGIATEDVMSTMKSLGDVAAGVSVPISRVAINYGQVATLGKLQGREVRDFAMAGIPLIEELAKNLKKSKDEITEMVTAGQIGFPMVEAAFKSMSSEGGKFYNLMEKQNASVTGQISNLTDKWQVMLNEIGQSNEGLIYSGISGTKDLIDNYKQIGEILSGLIAIYGVYKVAVMTVMATETTRVAVIEAKRAAILADITAQEASAAAAAKQAAADQATTALMLSNESARSAANIKTAAAKQAASVATAELIALEKAYAITITEVNAAVAGGVATSAQQQMVIQNELMAVERARIVAKKANAAAEKAITAEQVLNSNIAAKAVAASQAQQTAAIEAGIVTQRTSLLASQTATAGEIAAARAKSISAAAQKLLNATMLNNPYVLFAAAVGSIAYGLYRWYNYQTDLEKATKKLNEEVSIEKDKASELFAALKYATQGTDEWKKAKDKIIGQYGEYLTGQEKELSNADQIAIAYGKVNKAIEGNIAAKIRGESLNAVSAEINPQIAKAKEALLNSVGKTLGRDAKANVNQQLGIIDLIKYEVDPVKKEELKKQFSALGAELKKTAGGAGFSVIEYEVYQINKYLNEYQARVDEINKAFGTQKAKIDSKQDLPVATITAEQQRAKLRLDLIAAEKELINLETKKFDKNKGEDPLKAIADQKEVIKGLKDQLGIKEEKTKKEIDEIEAVKKAMETANGAELDALALRLVLLEDEKAARENILKLAIANAQIEIDGTDVSINTQEPRFVKLKGGKDKKPELQKGIDFQKKGEELTEKQKENAKETAERFYEIADSAAMLADMLGDSNKELSSMLNGVSNIAGSFAGVMKGDPTAILNTALSIYTLIQEVGGDMGSAERAASIDKVNKLLEKQADIVAKSERKGGELAKRKAEIETLEAKGETLAFNQSEAERRLSEIRSDWWNLSQVIFANRKKLKAEIEQTKLDTEANKKALEEAKQAYIDALAPTENVIADSIAESFMDGNTAVDDFAEYTNRILKEAVIDAFKSSVLGPEVTKSVEMLAGFLEDGTMNNDELKKWTEFNQKLKDDSAAKWEAYTKYMPEVFKPEDAKPDSMSGKISAAITEQTGSELLGLFRRNADDTRVVRDYSRLAVDNLINIEKNTFNTVTEVQNAVVELKIISKNAQQQWIKGI
jgi:tape measure domain-containing protein